MCFSSVVVVAAFSCFCAVFFVCVLFTDTMDTLAISDVNVMNARVHLAVMVDARLSAEKSWLQIFEDTLRSCVSW